MKKILRDAWLESIKEGVDSKDFRHFYIKNDNEWNDTAKNGLLSCAIFVSRKLSEFLQLISSPHATVDSTIIDMKKSGWYEIKKLNKGAILLWEAKKTSTGFHKHIGVYIGDDNAISHSSKNRAPHVHHYTYNQKRNIISIYWNNKLNDPII